MYSIQNKFDNAIDVLAYTISAMVDSGFMPCDIDEFLYSAVGNGNYNLLIKSLDAINECNKVIKSTDDEYTWRDKYYGTDEEILLDPVDGEPEYEFEFIPDSDYFDDEAYEGFDSCPNRIYNSTEYEFSDDIDDCDYYDCTHRQYKY